MGAMIVLVMVILLIMGMMSMSSSMQTSGTARTYRRVLDVRSALEVGESAISEAVTIVRRSMDRGSVPESADNYRQTLLSALENDGPLFTAKIIKPERTRATFAGWFPVSDVKIDLVDAYLPRPQPGQSANDLDLPQGILEFTVEVGGAQKMMAVKRQIRQRRLFYVWADPATLGPNGELDPASAQFTLHSHALGTVIDQR
jgi:hypothetical protein